MLSKTVAITAKGCVTLTLCLVEGRIFYVSPDGFSWKSDDGKYLLYLSDLFLCELKDPTVTFWETLQAADINGSPEPS